MVFSWTPLLLVSFWQRRPPRQARFGNSNVAILRGNKRGKSLSRTPSSPDGYFRLHAFVRRKSPVRNSRSELLPGHLCRYSTERSPEPLGGKMNITMKD